MVSITNLKKNLGSFSLSIDGLQIDSPGIYGLIGPNGCGKSTLAKLISGILLPDSGKIDVCLDSRDITMVTQKPYIMDDTVFHNIEYPLKVRGIKDRKSLCEEYLSKINFLDRKNQRAQGLSGGEKQKLAMLRAMIFNPKLIILDETMTEMDLDGLDMFENMILERQQENQGIWIIISHQLVLIKKLCNYIFFLNDGKLEAEGRAEELLSSPNSQLRRYLEKLNETFNR